MSGVWVLGLVLAIAAPDEVRALLERGREEMATGRYAEAAEHLEAFATRGAAEPEARGVLEEAMGLRAGLGQIKEAQADWRRLIAWPGQSPEAVAVVHMAGWQLARDDGERLEFVDEFLRVHARHAGADRVAIAEIEAGKLRWAQACGARGVDDPPGLCASGWLSVPAKVTAEEPIVRGGRRACAGLVAWEFRVHRRDARLVAAALDHLTRGAQAGSRAPEDPARAQALAVALAEAELVRLDHELEALMVMTVPKDVVLPAYDRSAPYRERERQERATSSTIRYRDAIFGSGRALEKRYDRLWDARISSVRIAVPSRMVAVHRTSAMLLYRAPLPVEVRDAAAARPYCKGAAENVVASAEQWERALSMCVGVGAIVGFSREAEMCLAVLERISPRKYVPQAEIVGVGGPIDWEPEALAVVLAAPVIE